MLRPMLLVALYSTIFYNTWETVVQNENYLTYSIAVILGGWLIFSIVDGLIVLMRRTFREMIKAVGMMVIAGLIIAPFFLFPVWGTTIAYTMFFLLVILPFLVMCVIAWGALGG